MVGSLRRVVVEEGTVGMNRDPSAHSGNTVSAGQTPGTAVSTRRAAARDSLSSSGTCSWGRAPRTPARSEACQWLGETVHLECGRCLTASELRGERDPRRQSPAPRGPPG